MDAAHVEQRAVLEFWFRGSAPVSVAGGGGGAAGAGGHGDGDDELLARPEWFAKDPAFDYRIEERFAGLIATALAGRCEDWIAAPVPALAYVIVLDQFTRNVFRDTPGAFAGDPQALSAARRIVAAGWDQALAPVQRSFCYMPFEHSESIEDQRESLRLFGTLRNDLQAAGSWEWAVKHHDVIARFRRFPHRNAILGRQSTEQERAFLEQPGSRF